MDEPRPVEIALIRAHQPLLNLHGRGLVALGPPQLRAIGGFERSRAAWLFSTAWIAVLTAAEDDWKTWSLRTRSIGLQVGEEGWPSPVGHGGRPVKVTLPTEDVARRIVCRAHAVDFNEYDYEGPAWWSAYAGLAFRPQAQSVDDALHLAFGLEVDVLDMPRKVRSATQLVDLLKLIKLLPSVAH